MFTRYRTLISFNIFMIVMYTALRFFLLIHSHIASGISFADIMRVFGFGFMFDMSFILYFNIIFSLLFFIIPDFLWQTKVIRGFIQLLLFIMTFCIGLGMIAEILFWNEFHARFNFITIDSLIYTNTVLKDVWHNYHIIWITAILLAVVIVVYYLLQKIFFKVYNQRSTYISRFPYLLIYIILIGGCFLLVDQDVRDVVSDDSYICELASNGPYQLFSAFRNNTINFSKFYNTLDPKQAKTIVAKDIMEYNSTDVDSSRFGVERKIINNPKHLRKPNYNVVLITVESLSAKDMTYAGQKENITPFLDTVSKQSYFFNNFYATGTRTVRGLEAITLSMPPTPGRSIIKRIGYQSKWNSLGGILHDRGYDSVFFYGGKGFFDNLNAFFLGNKYRKFDANDMPDSEPENAKTSWGYADEFVFKHMINQANNDYKKHKPFFFHIMTTSNHKPYTIPSGRISQKARYDAGGVLNPRHSTVKYTDWVIHNFMDNAKKQPWFKNTIFLILADHTNHASGHTTLPIWRYHIPFIIYAPSIIKHPRTIKTLSSQVDVAPTLLGILGFNYNSTFFGKNILNMSNQQGRAFISTYQKLGYIDHNNNLSVLMPNFHNIIHLTPTPHHPLTKPQQKSLLNLTISYYQNASEVYTQHKKDTNNRLLK